MRDSFGLIPGLGEVCDGANAIISLAQGDYVDAGLNALAMIPFYGWTATGVKWSKNALRHIDDIPELGRIDNVAYAFAGAGARKGETKLSPELAKQLAEKAIQSGTAFVKKIDDVIATKDVREITKGYSNQEGLISALSDFGFPRPEGVNQLHHIVCQTDAAAEETRQILKSYDIDINSIANVVYLPNHKGRHLSIYSDRVNEELQKAHYNLIASGNTHDKIKIELIKTLNEIRLDLLNYDSRYILNKAYKAL